MQEQFYTEEAKKIIEKLFIQLEPITGEMMKLKEQKIRTTEEEELLKNYAVVLERSMQYISDMQALLGDKLYRKATAYYFHLKDLAEKGNEEARAVYEKLKPLYEDSLKENMDDSMN